MNQKVLLALGLVVVLLLCGVAFWLGRSSSSTTSVVETPPPPPPKPPVAEAIDVEPALKVGTRIEALSAEGWMPATIQEISGDQALVRYERAALGEERVDVRLIRKPESELVAAPAPSPAPRTAVTPPAPVLGPRPATTAAALPIGTYDCELGAEKAQLEILSDRDYGAFGEDAGRYSYDGATSRITWEDGVLAGKPAKFVAQENTIVTSMGGQALPCTLRR